MPPTSMSPQSQSPELQLLTTSLLNTGISPSQLPQHPAAAPLLPSRLDPTSLPLHASSPPMPPSSERPDMNRNNSAISSSATDGESKAGSAASAGSAAANSKFTLTIDCDGLLKPSSLEPNTFVAKTADEAAAHYQLSSLLAIPMLQEIRIKCFHTCGSLGHVPDDTCVALLWSVGGWFVEEYSRIGRVVRYDYNLNDGGQRDLHEPDATLTVLID